MLMGNGETQETQEDEEFRIVDVFEHGTEAVNHGGDGGGHFQTLQKMEVSSAFIVISEFEHDGMNFPAMEQANLGIS